MTNARPIAFNTIACVALCFAGPLFSARTACAADDAVSAAKAAVGRYAGPQTVWEGPSSAPVPAKDKLIVYLSGDEQNDISREYGLWAKIPLHFLRANCYTKKIGVLMVQAACRGEYLRSTDSALHTLRTRDASIREDRSSGTRNCLNAKLACRREFAGATPCRVVCGTEGLVHDWLRPVEIPCRSKASHQA